MAPELVTDPEGIARTGEAFGQDPALLLIVLLKPATLSS